MEISDHELFAVPPRWLSLRLEESDGAVDRGEPVVQGPAPTVEERAGEPEWHNPVWRHDDGCVAEW